MDSPGVTPGSALSSNDENPRVKFLCSFSGSILPRPQDGKLRYVGGETRIVSVPRDITCEDLMGKMRELFEGAIVLKYQQPDEDLDALVSVVNDDDVVNMMEEYDKLDSGDGFTRLRIFLFSNTDQNGSMHFGDGDEWDNERRYVDALNSLNESPDFRNQSVESPVMGSFDDSGYFSQLNLEGSFHGQRNMELPMAQMNLRQLTIPRSSSQQQVTQRYSEMEAPWSPAYYSPRQPVAEFPTSPSTRYRTPYPDYSDRVPEPQYHDNVVLIPTGPNEKAGFPGNIFQGSGVYEGNSVCGNCRMTFNRNQVYPDYAWRPSEQQHLEPPNLVNGYFQVPNSCKECPQNREIYMLNSDPNMHPSFYTNDPKAMYPDTHTQERDFISHHPNQESKSHIPVSGRLPDNYIIENGTSTPVGHANVCDGARIQSPYIHHEGQRYNRPGFDYGSQVFQDPSVPQIHLSSIHGNAAYTYGADNLYQMQPGHIPPQTLWRNVHTPLPGGPVPSYGTTVPPQLVNGSVGHGFTPRGRVLENQSPWAEPSQKFMGIDGSLVSQAVNLIPNTHTLENYRPHIIDPIQPAVDLLELGTSKDPPVSFLDVKVNTVGDSGNENDVTELVIMKEKGIGEGSKEINNGETEDSGTCGVICGNPDALAPYLSVNGDVSAPDTIGNDSIVKVIETTPEQVPDDRLGVLPELIASAKEAALQTVKEVKDKVQGVSDLSQEDAHNEIHGADGNVNFEVGSDNNNVSKSKIEQTKAEEEAIDHGLQTIKNEDLEEIRELGSGTYGSVFHGKWKGSDVAIKRIKASCFAGKPSERERLIADFWKEAQILSSLHHPNVVAFYGVVRDGPDGSLATVTEFMINGSLKQFLQKKDRTIDRRKRLMIAMDTAFGMEYLHGKNIVHFDLKCENLLVNMRDPHRPVCKIGDLGLSKVKRHTLVSGGVRGTLPWIAPELLSGKSNMVTEKIDVYSFGIVMWELLTGDEPYADMHCASIIGGIVNNTLRPQIPTWCDPEWKALMESSWASEPSQRPSFSEISQKLRTMAAAMNLK